MSADPLKEAERLVRRIAAFNGVYHSLRDGALGEDAQQHTVRLARETKELLQLALLRGYPSLASLVAHTAAGSPEATFSVRLTMTVAGRRDACHLPVRLAEKHLTDAELRDALNRGALSSGAPR